MVPNQGKKGEEKAMFWDHLSTDNKRLVGNEMLPSHFVIQQLLVE